MKFEEVGERADAEPQKLRQKREGGERDFVPVEACTQQKMWASPEMLHNLRVSLGRIYTKAVRLQEPVRYFVMDNTC